MFVLHLFTFISVKKKKKNKMKAQRLISRVRENADLLKLLLDLAFLFCGLLKQVNTALEGKTIGAIFAHFSVSVILFSGSPKILIVVAFTFKRISVSVQNPPTGFLIRTTLLFK